MDGVRKSFRAGVPGCSITVRVLGGVSLRLRIGEVVGVAGAAGTGKSALLLCAAGLLQPDKGTVSWFGLGTGHAAAPGGLAEYFPAGSASSAIGLERAVRSGARLLLIDHVSPASLGTLSGVIAQLARRYRAAFLVACRDRDALRRLEVRTLDLRGGRLCSEVSAPSAPRHGGQRKRSAARARSALPSEVARASIRSTCGRSLRSPQ